MQGTDKERVVHLYYWKYDDGSIAYSIQGKIKQLKKHDYCAGKDKLHDVYRKLKKSCSEDARVKKEKLKIPVGLKYLLPYNVEQHDCKKLKDGFDEFLKLLKCHRTKKSEYDEQVMNLISGILAGYCSRLILKNDKKIQVFTWSHRAPILTVSGPFDTFEFIREVIDAVVVRTYDSDCEDFQIKQPKVLPSKGKPTDQIKACAYIRFKKKDVHYQAQYRDTAVLIHESFFKPQDIKKFILKNPWASIVRFQPRLNNSEFKAIELKKWVIDETFDMGWDRKKVREFFTQYTHWLGACVEEDELRTVICSYLKWIDEQIYQGIISGQKRLTKSEEQQKKMQVLSLYLLLCFCRKEKILSQEDAAQVLNDWSKCILPMLKFDEVNGNMNPEVPKKTASTLRKKLENVLSQMIQPEYAEHFLYVEDGGIYASEHPGNPNCKYWGYVVSDDNKKKVKEDKFSHALYLRRKTFEEVAQEVFSLSSTDLDSIWKNAPKFSAPYLPAVRRSARFKKENDKTADSKEKNKEVTQAYVIDIDAMNFLGEHQKQLLLDLFSAVSNETLA